MKRYFRSLFALLAVVLLLSTVIVSCDDGDSGVQEANLTLTYIGDANTNFGRAADRFKSLVEIQSKGKVKVTLSPNYAVTNGDNLAALKLMTTGGVDATLHGGVIYTSLDPRFEVLNLPYIITSHERAYAVMDSAVGEELLKGLTKLNVEGLAFGENGFRQVTNNVRPITQVADLKGLKMRVPETPLLVDTMRALGADPTIMTFTQVYEALKAGRLDGQENPLSVIQDFKVYEVQKYLTLWNYSWDSVVFGFSKQRLEALPRGTQKIIRSAAKESMSHMRTLVENDDKVLADRLRSEGMQIVELTPQQREAFVQATKPLYEARRASIGAELIERVQKIASGK